MLSTQNHPHCLPNSARKLFRLFTSGAPLPCVLVLLFGIGCGVESGAEQATTMRQGTSTAGSASVRGAIADRPVDDRSAQRGPTVAADELVSRYVVLEGAGSIASVRGRDLREPAVQQLVTARARVLRQQHATLRQAIEATGAIIVGDMVHVANAFQVKVARSKLDSLRRLPGVSRLETPTVVTPTLSRAVPLLGVPHVWDTAVGLRGEGVRIGILDTGIDYLHAHLGGAGDPQDATDNDHVLIEPGTFPTAKVIGGWDFAGDDYDALGINGSVIPEPDEDPIDCGGHGTHVAGIAAGVGVTTDGSAYTGPWDASLDPAGFALYPGVAPAAQLYSLKIFGCEGSTDLLIPALELAVDPNEDGDVSDRLDVVNASLGSAYGSGSETENAAWGALSDAGTLCVLSAGNNGDPSRAHFTTSYPGSLAEGLTVGSSFAAAASNSFLTLEVTAPSSISGSYPLGQTAGAPDISTLGSFNGEAVPAEPELGCDPMTNGADLSGKIAIVRRGTCYFTTKAQNAADAGAVGLLIVDNTYSDWPMDSFGSAGGHVIPMWIIRRADGESLIQSAPVTASVTNGVDMDLVVGPDYMAQHSSRGPTADAHLLKPDVTAPGVQILSALAGTGVEGAAWNGTSMAAPMVAGAAALLRQGRPSLGPLEIKALLTSTARPVTNTFGDRFLSTLAGAGRVQVDDALSATLTAVVDGVPGEAGASFGVILASAPRTETRTVVVSNLGTEPAALDVALEPSTSWPGATVTVSPETLDVPAGQTATVTLTLTVDPAALPAAPNYDAFTPPVSNTSLDGVNGIDAPATFLTEASGAVSFRPTGSASAVATVAYHGIVRAAAERTIGEVSGCLDGADATQPSLSLAGTAATHDNATSVLELGTQTTSFDDPTGPDAARDILAVGALVDPDKGQIFFGVATAADWATPARGWFSEVGIEIDIDEDGTADYLVTAESFQQPDRTLPTILITGAPFARVVELSTGALNETFQPLNGVMPAYPGGIFLPATPPEVYDTQVYLNRVVVFPVALSDIGRNATTDGVITYRGVSGVSRVPLVLSRPMEDPIDTTDWVRFDAAAPHVRLPDCHNGTSLCPNAPGSIPLEIPADLTELPTLLVLHHTNGSGPRFETVDLAAALESSDLSVTAGAGGELESDTDGTTTFTVANDGGSARVGVQLTFAVTGGSLVTVESTSGSCDDSGCELGDLAPDASVMVTVTARPAGDLPLEITASVEGEKACDTDATNDSASATFTVTEAPVEPEPKSGCGCHAGERADGAAGLLWMLLALGLLLRRRRAH